MGTCEELRAKYADKQTATMASEHTKIPMMIIKLFGFLAGLNLFLTPFIIVSINTMMAKALNTTFIPA